MPAWCARSGTAARCGWLPTLPRSRWPWLPWGSPWPSWDVLTRLCGPFVPCCSRVPSTWHSRPWWGRRCHTLCCFTSSLPGRHQSYAHLTR
ncbi:unnamed protein product [Ixodes pacificus]